LFKDTERGEMEGKEGATAVISAGRDVKIVFWNEKTKFLFGYSEELQWVGAPSLSRAPPIPRAIEEMIRGG